MPDEIAPTPEEYLARAQLLESTRSDTYAQVEGLYRAAVHSEDPIVHMTASLWLAAAAARRLESATATSMAERALVPGLPYQLGVEAIFVIEMATLESGSLDSQQRALDGMELGVRHASETSRARLACMLGDAYARYSAPRQQRQFHAQAIALGGTGIWSTRAAAQLHGAGHHHILRDEFRDAAAAYAILEPARQLFDDQTWTRYEQDVARLAALGPAALAAARFCHEHAADTAAGLFVELAARCGAPAVEATANALLDSSLAGLTEVADEPPMDVVATLVKIGLSSLAVELESVVEFAGNPVEREAATKALAYRDFNSGADAAAWPRMLRLADSADPDTAASARLLAARIALRAGRLDDADGLFARAAELRQGYRGTLGRAEVAAERGEFATSLDLIRAALASAEWTSANAWVPAQSIARVATKAAGVDPDAARAACGLGLALPRNGFTSAVETAATAIEGAGGAGLE